MKDMLLIKVSKKLKRWSRFEWTVLLRVFVAQLKKDLMMVEGKSIWGSKYFAKVVPLCG